MSASPESLTSTRPNAGGSAGGRTAGAVSMPVRNAPTVVAPAGSGGGHERSDGGGTRRRRTPSSPRNGEAAELDQLGALVGKRLRDRLGRVVDPRLVEQHAAGLRGVEALVQHPFHDLVAGLLG